ncbi:hypothetical protein LCGC14_1055590, partial [marine sediment metagenome]
MTINIIIKIIITQTTVGREIIGINPKKNMNAAMTNRILDFITIPA